MKIGIFSLIAWDFINQRPQAFARELAQLGHEIVYIEPSDFSDGFDAWLDRRLKGDIDGFEAEAGIQAIEGGLIPIRTDYRDIFHHNDDLAKAYAESLAGYGLDFAIVLAPEYAPVLEYLQIPYAYDHVDDTQHMDGIDTQLFVDMMERLKSGASFNMYIQEPAADRDPKGFFLPNGIDTHIFSPIERPKMFDGVILSAIAKWFDMDSVVRAESRLLLIGPMDHDMGNNHQRFFAARRPNLHWIPQVDKQTANHWLSSASVGLVPFKTNHPVVPYAMPIKILEYFLAGLPVVTYRSEGIERFYGDRVTFYSPDGESAPCLDEAIMLACQDRRDHRPFALQFNWPDLVARLDRKIRDSLSVADEEPGAHSAFTPLVAEDGKVSEAIASELGDQRSPNIQGHVPPQIPGEDEESLRKRLVEMRKLLQERTLWATHVDQEVRYQMDLVKQLRKDIGTKDEKIQRLGWESEALKLRLPPELRPNSMSVSLANNPYDELAIIRRQWWFKLFSPGWRGWFERATRRSPKAPRLEQTPSAN